MAVSVRIRPFGYIPSANTFTASICYDATSVYFLKTTHNLTTNEVVYIKCPIEEYNGYKLVTTVTANSFRIRDLESGAFITFAPHETVDDIFSEGTVTQMSSLQFWHCVHLPIVYKLSNTLWPTNSADTTRTMTVTDSNGYCAISASGDIKASGSAAALEYVKVTNAGDYNGVYQIISYTNDTTFVIDLAYSAAADTALTAGNIQYYYNNYVVKVRIYGGLPDAHYFNDQREYELITTLDLKPDEDNLCVFSVSDYLMKHIKLRNNTLLGTLPNNLDAYTMFYIEYAEVYDDSDGTTLSTSTASYTSDKSSFEGYAVNAKLPFKNVYAGSLSEYVSQNANQKFLTAFTRPSIFSGKYFDLSYLINFYTQSIGDLTNGDFASGALTPWSNTGSGQDWSVSSFRANVTVTNPQESKRLEQDFDFKEGFQYLIKWQHIVSSYEAGYSVVCYLSNDTYSQSQSVGSLSITGNATTNKVSVITADADYTKIIFEVNLNTP